MTGLPPPPAAATAPWTQRNQLWLTATLGRLCERMLAPVPTEDISDCVEMPTPADFTPALLQCARAFDLSPFEREILLLTAGLEFDRNVRSAVLQLQSGVSSRATFGLALERLTQPHWDALSPDGPLRHWLLVEPDSAAPLTQAPLRIDEHILHVITGVGARDAALAGVAAIVDADEATDVVPRSFLKSVATAITRPKHQTIACLQDDAHDTVRLRDTAIAVVRRARRPALWIDAHDLLAHTTWLPMLARRIDRQAALTGALPVIAVEGSTAEIAASKLTSHLGSSLLWLGRPATALAALPLRRRLVRFDLPAPDVLQARKSLVARWSAGTGATPDPETRAAIGAVSTQFHLRPAALDSIVAGLSGVAPEELPAALWAAARREARGGLELLAQRVESRTALADLVLPAGPVAALGDIVRQLRHRERVHRDWGFAAKQSRGLGLIALFAGESGTGKTMAAEAIANEVGLDLYRVDLASLVSKYIGETEKNLKSLFDTAEASGSVLLFDEADALFGKRSEVKDSHDRYANIEVAYLLQRVEAYRGLAILTTNMKSALDRAFLRRIRFIVTFPFPDLGAREQIWRRQFPPAAPLGRIDFAGLAKLNLPGGNIRSIALNAAFRAAGNGGIIDHHALTGAVRAELAKLERNMNEIPLGDGA